MTRKLTGIRALGLLLALILALGLLPAGAGSARAEEPERYSVSCRAAPEGWGSISADRESAAVNEEVTVTVSPAGGYELDSVKVYAAEGGALLQTIKENDGGQDEIDCSFDMPEADVVVEASFRLLHYSISTWVSPAEGGTLQVSHDKAQAGTAVDVRVEANSGYALVSLELLETAGGLIRDITGQSSFKMPGQSVTVKATFQLETPPVTLYPVWVGETQVSGDNAEDVLGDGTVRYTPGDGTGTLSITGSPAITGLHEGAMIYAEGQDLVIEASGGLTLENGEAAYGILTDGGLSITGDVTGGAIRAEGGELLIDGSADISGVTEGIYAKGDVKITGETVTVSASDDKTGRGIVSAEGGVTVVTGTWIVDGPLQAISAKTGIDIPDTHQISAPEDGATAVIDEVTTVVGSDGSTVATHVVIEPITETSYTITFDANGGSPDGETLETHGDGTLDAEELSAISEGVKREGYKLMGWSLSKNGPVQDLSGYTFTGDTTVYAVWEIKTYTVSFAGNGGSSTPSQTVEHGKTAQEPDDPVKAGSSFDGWFTDTALTKEYDFSTPVTGDLTLYAKWSQVVKYTVVSGGGSIYGKTSGRTLVIVVKRTPMDNVCYDHFRSVDIDGLRLQQGTDYSVKPGSTILTLEPSYLKNLNSGSHIVSINFDDGAATTGLTVRAGTAGGGTARAGRGGTRPYTGESGDLMLWTGLLLGSGLCLGALVYARRKLRRAGKL